MSLRRPTMSLLDKMAEVLREGLRDDWVDDYGTAHALLARYEHEKREHQQERPVTRTQVRGRRLRRLTADESAIWSAVLRGQAKWDGTYGLPVWTVQEPCDHRLHEGDPGYDPEQPEQEAWVQTVYGIRGDWLSLAHPLDLDVFCSQCGERAG